MLTVEEKLEWIKKFYWLRTPFEMNEIKAEFISDDGKTSRFKLTYTHSFYPTLPNKFIEDIYNFTQNVYRKLNPNWSAELPDFEKELMYTNYYSEGKEKRKEKQASRLPR